MRRRHRTAPCISLTASSEVPNSLRFTMQPVVSSNSVTQSASFSGPPRSWATQGCSAPLRLPLRDPRSGGRRTAGLRIRGRVRAAPRTSSQRGACRSRPEPTRCAHLPPPLLPSDAPCAGSLCGQRSGIRVSCSRFQTSATASPRSWLRRLWGGPRSARGPSAHRRRRGPPGIGRRSDVDHLRHDTLGRVLARPGRGPARGEAELLGPHAEGAARPGGALAAAPSSRLDVPTKSATNAFAGCS